MDPRSEGARALLLALQDGQRDLPALRQHYADLGAASAQTYLKLSGRPFTVANTGADRAYEGSVALGVLVRNREGREYEFGVDLQWDSAQWTIDTEAWIDNPEGGQTLLRALTRRVARDLETCLLELETALADLRSFGDLLDCRWR